MPKLRSYDPAIEARASELRHIYGGYMTVANVMSELGNVSRKTAMKFVCDLPSYSMTGKNRYDVRDVARKIESFRS